MKLRTACFCLSLSLAASLAWAEPSRSTLIRQEFDFAFEQQGEIAHVRGQFAYRLETGECAAVVYQTEREFPCVLRSEGSSGTYFFIEASPELFSSALEGTTEGEQILNSGLRTIRLGFIAKPDVPLKIQAVIGIRG